MNITQLYHIYNLFPGEFFGGFIKEGKFCVKAGKFFDKEGKFFGKERDFSLSAGNICFNAGNFCPYAGNLCPNAGNLFDNAGNWCPNEGKIIVVIWRFVLEGENVVLVRGMIAQKRGKGCTKV